MDEILSSDDLRLLADIGFIATSRGLASHAGAIFKALRAFRPEQEAGFLGLGMTDILSGDPAAAVDKLKDAPKTPGVEAFLGIALIQVGSINEGRTMLTNLIETAPDTPFAQIAQETLNTLSAA